MNELAGLWIIQQILQAFFAKDTGDYPAKYTVFRNKTVVYDTGFWEDSVFIWLIDLEEGVHNITCVVENLYGGISSDWADI